MALAHNGNLVNSGELRRELELEGSIFHTTSDTEVISYIITKERLTAPSIEEAVNQAVYRIKGAYSLVIMSPSKLIAVRVSDRFATAKQMTEDISSRPRVVHLMQSEQDLCVT